MGTNASPINNASSSHDFDDILGGDADPLDRPVKLTVFRDANARTLSSKYETIRQFASRVHSSTAASKSGLPLLKLASFGDVPTVKGSLRHDGNVTSIDGIEGDYDAGKVTVTEAAAKLRGAGIAALIYSTPSHTPTAPRWRVLCPLSEAATPSDRERLCARLNGALAGMLSPESFTLSQAYYFGHVDGSAAPEMSIVEGRALDCAADLDSGATGRDGAPYRPLSFTPSAAIPANDEEDEDANFRIAPDWDRIESALSFIPIGDGDSQEAGGRDMWLRVGQAIHHASSGSSEGFDRWNAWSKGGAKYDARHIARDWKSFRSDRRKRVSIATLYDLAKRYGWGASAVEALDPIDTLGTEPTAAPIKALRFLSPADCSSAPTRGYVVKGLFAPYDIACIFGAPGAGKSLIAPHIGYQVALGASAFGMRTKPGRVLYVAAEDPHGMRGRVTALRTRHGDAPEFVLVEGVSDLLAEGSTDLTALRAAVGEHKPALIFLDTLAMSFPGLEENSAQDMGRVAAVCRSLTKHGAAVVLIHHDTKAQGGTPRGHSLLNGALDVALHLSARDEAGIVRGRLTKNRNGSCDRDIAFRISIEERGEDEDGDAINLPVVQELAPGDAPRQEKLKAPERAALKIFHDMDAGGAVTENAWRLACVSSRTVCSSDEVKSRQQAVRRAVSILVRRSLVLLGDGMVRRPDSVGRAFDDAD